MGRPPLRGRGRDDDHTTSHYADSNVCARVGPAHADGVRVTVRNTTTSAGRVTAVSRVSGAPEASGQSAGVFAVVPAVAPAPARRAA